MNYFLLGIIGAWMMTLTCIFWIKLFSERDNLIAGLPFFFGALLSFASPFLLRALEGESTFSLNKVYVIMFVLGCLMMLNFLFMHHPVMDRIQNFLDKIGIHIN